MVELGRELLLERRWHGKPVRQHLREFGLLLGVVFTAVSIYCLWFQPRVSLDVAGWFFTGAAAVFLAYRRPSALYYPWKVWMGLAEVLGRMINPLVLFVLWIAAVLPTAIVLRLSGKRVMDLRFRAPVESYWEDRDPSSHDLELLKKQY